MLARSIQFILRFGVVNPKPKCKTGRTLLVCHLVLSISTFAVPFCYIGRFPHQPPNIMLLPGEKEHFVLSDRYILSLPISSVYLLSLPISSVYLLSLPISSADLLSLHISSVNSWIPTHCKL